MLWKIIDALLNRGNGYRKRLSPRISFFEGSLEPTSVILPGSHPAIAGHEKCFGDETGPDYL